MKQNILHIVKTLPKEQQELFTNVKIICAEMKIEGKSRSDFKGLDFAVEELTKNEDKHIYIASFLPKNSLRQVSGKPEAKFLFNQPHIHFIQLPFSAQQFVDSVLQQLGTETVDNAEKTEAFAETIEKAV
ncbi:MAG: hypothetical protein LBU27_05635 [Candidatus Peribacteria bacterium]|jgi:hypothetical protein|nr:hypothetical protein [Candidatus Peribacteria bacterium]